MMTSLIRVCYYSLSFPAPTSGVVSSFSASGRGSSFPLARERQDTVLRHTHLLSFRNFTSLLLTLCRSNYTNSICRHIFLFDFYSEVAFLVASQHSPVAIIEIQRNMEADFNILPPEIIDLICEQVLETWPHVPIE